MPGGKVRYFGANQQVCVSGMEELVQLVARCLGQTTFEFVEIPKEEYEAMKQEGRFEY